MLEGARKRAWDWIAGPSVPEEDPVPEISRDFLNWQRQPYYNHFIEYLEREKDRPLAISEQANMIVAATRQNTFREILDHLRKAEQQAHAILNEETNG